MPKSVKYLFFLFFLIITVALVPFVVHMMGIHCNSGKQVQTTSILDFSDNYEISQMSRDDIYNATNYNAKQGFTFMGGDLKLKCAPLVKLDHTSTLFGDFYALCDRNDTISENSNCDYALRVVRFNGIFSKKPKCYVCDDLRDVTFYSLSPFDNDAINGKYCFSEAFPNNSTDCGKTDDCEMPYGYMFDNTTGNFKCFDDTLCGGNASKTIYSVDIKLKSMGAKDYYPPAQNENDYQNAISIICDNNLKPQISLYRIPVLDYKFWILLMVIGAMFFFYVKYLRQ